ncbi:glycosyltransferase family 4 protein [Rhizorhapis sp. SPR117]|uniref:glycosyltransferase family 4 protein n=1 Tax=Rhizorhapis sp. SPR117 TaxID=2912611 RepID=UPI001F1C17C7|nr:glycosyltransferase family 4 protein [Rhizorhapis sp. SPR117]
MAGERPATICFPFTGDAVGGSYISVLGLIRKLDRNRFTPLVLPQRPDGAVAALFREHGIDIEESFQWSEQNFARRIGPRALIKALGDVPSQLRFLRSRNVDIVHSNDGRTHATWALATRLAGAKLLWHHRGNPSALGLRLAAPLLADQVVAVSQFALPRPGLFSAAGKSEVVHSPFDTTLKEDRAAAHAALATELNAPDDAIFIGYFGTFIDRKRPALFIDSIAALVARNPGSAIYGVLFGEDLDGRTQNALETRVKKHSLTENVRFMGWRKPGSRWIAACDILMVPAVNEPFGRTLIEAMLVGTPIVATRSGGNIEALRDGEIGQLVAPESADALAAACLRYCESPAFARLMAHRAERDARMRFGEEAHARRIMEIYERMLAGKAGASACSQRQAA